MTSRTEGSSTYTQGFDAENRLVSVTGAANATFTYDGDGVRVKKVEGGVTTYYVGGYYERDEPSGTVTKYYYLGGQRVAMKVVSTVYYLQ